MFIPVVNDWCKQTALSPSKLFIPLSFAAVLGGVITIIGTSTNLVVNGLWIQSGNPSFRLLDITPLGLPVAIAGIVYLMVAGRWLLPERKKAFSLGDDPREYTVEMVVEPGSPMVGQTIEEAGLRHLHGMYLMEIDRAGEVIAAVGAGQRLQAHDHLVFVGVVDSVVDLQKMRGLAPAASRLFNLDVPRLDRVMVEAVVSNSCPIVGSTIRDGKSKTFAVYQPTRLKRLDGHRTSNGFHEPRQIGDFHAMKTAIEQLAQGQNATALFLYRHDDLVHTIGSNKLFDPHLSIKHAISGNQNRLGCANRIEAN
ncbi:MAG: SLC13 family permease [Betaproteobacteria bacterium]|nr:SLC13 family permease [Betaproteobacteria bacterium]